MTGCSGFEMPPALWGSLLPLHSPSALPYLLPALSTSRAAPQPYPTHPLQTHPARAHTSAARKGVFRFLPSSPCRAADSFGSFCGLGLLFLSTVVRKPLPQKVSAGDLVYRGDALRGHKPNLPTRTSWFSLSC